MRWLSMISGGANQNALRELAHGVATRSHAAVLSRVEQRLPELRLNEARGYVRARSRAIIQREIEVLVASRPNLHTKRSQLQQMASEAAIRHVIWQMLRDRKQQPAAAATDRRAA